MTMGRSSLPKAFLGTAERYGLMNDIDRWVVDQAIGLVAEREEQGDRLQLEVNLSAKSLGDPRFPEWVEQRLAGSAIDASCLIFEITETAAIANMDEAKNFVNRLTRLGCRFALDDFGAGFGSFHYVKYLPVDYVKIDGDFVRNVTAEQHRPVGREGDRPARPRPRKEDDRGVRRRRPHDPPAA